MNSKLIKASFLFVPLLLTIFTLSCDGDGCGFDPNLALNGSNAALQTSEWDCSSPDLDEPFSFAAFSDRTGISTEGSFVWDETVCRGAEGTLIAVLEDGSTALISGMVGNLDGSTAEGTLTGSFISEEGEVTATAACVLDTTPDDTI